jgi:hypothetical protein
MLPGRKERNFYREGNIASLLKPKKSQLNKKRQICLFLECRQMSTLTGVSCSPAIGQALLKTDSFVSFCGDDAFSVALPAKVVIILCFKPI